MVLSVKGLSVRLLLMVLLVWAAGVSGSRASNDAPPKPLADVFGGPFQLVDQNGLPKSDKDFRGKYMLIYFGYVSCPIICPTNMQEISAAVKALGRDADKIQPVFISLDPARDTPAKVKAFLAGFGPEFIGLTGTEMQVQAVAKAYRIIRRKVSPTDDKPEDYLVFHSTLMSFIGPDGRFLTFFPISTGGAEMARRMRTYFSNDPS